TWTYSWTLPAEGTFLLKSKAVDIATNEETPGPAITVQVDNVAPQSSVTSPEPGERVGLTVAVAGIASDNLAGVTLVEVSVDDGVTWTAAVSEDDWATWTYGFQAGAEGSLVVMSRATDALGNVETPGSGVEIQVDGTAPRILLGGFWDSNMTGTGGPLSLLAFCMDEDVERIELYYLGESTGLLLLDDGSQGDWAAGDMIYGFAIPDIGPGAPALTLEVSFRAFDDVGNWSEWPALVTE
ncbi:hypothetical protein JW905_00885, partial [bacterium]|nr:hypothetical protein [candidate division CSSED10-310 bacterium]